VTLPRLGSDCSWKDPRDGRRTVQKRVFLAGRRVFGRGRVGISPCLLVADHRPITTCLKAPLNAFEADERPDEEYGRSHRLVLERRSYGQGVLQLETRAYRRKDGSVAERGPYWYFHYSEQGRQRTIYVGKTAEPERCVAQRLVS
jgi:hypothetical protein